MSIHVNRFITPADLHNKHTTTVETPTGEVLALCDARWDELRADWHLQHTPNDPYAAGVKSYSFSGATGLPYKKGDGYHSETGALIYALRARASSDAAREYLEGNVGQHVLVAVHYRRKVIRETTLARLLREELLLGTPVSLSRCLSFGVFVIPDNDFAVPNGPRSVAKDREVCASSVEFALAGYLFFPGSTGAQNLEEQRYQELEKLVR